MPKPRTAAVTYITQQIPPDEPIPTSWYFGVRDSAGQPVGTEQSFDHTVPVVVFADLPAGTGYAVWAGQRAADGAALGDIVTSDPFDIPADLTVSFVATLTITRG